MGLISGLLTLPVSGPMSGIRFFLERLHEEAESRLTDQNRGFSRLIELSMRRNAGRLSEEEYAQEEAAIFEQLNSLRDEEEPYDEIIEEDIDFVPDDEQQQSAAGTGPEDEPGSDEAFVVPEFIDANEPIRWLPNRSDAEC